MGRVIEATPVTRIEGHARVRIELDDSGQVSEAVLQVLEFRGFERFVQGMQVELMPTLTTRICGTCPHAHHLASAKAVDRVFSVSPPPTAVLLRELLNCGSMIHSHAIHFFALAGPDLFVPANAPRSERNLLSLLKSDPDLVKRGLRLRSIGQRIAEAVGGRGTHPVTCVAGGMASGPTREQVEQIRRLAREAVELCEAALAVGRDALGRDPELLTALRLEVHDMGTVRDGVLDLYDGSLRVCRPDGSPALEFESEQYSDWLVEDALDTTYAKQVSFRDPNGAVVPYRVGPLARLNCADRIATPLAQEALEAYREQWGRPCSLTVMSHLARLIELLHHAEKAVLIAEEEALSDPNLRTPITATPRRGVAHVEAPRGVLIHDYTVDSDGLIEAANFLVATQHNISGLNASVRQAAERSLDAPDEVLLDRVEFAIRCYDPCLSCSTHQVGAMPLRISIHQGGQEVRRVTR